MVYQVATHYTSSSCIRQLQLKGVPVPGVSGNHSLYQIMVYQAATVYQFLMCHTTTCHGNGSWCINAHRIYQLLQCVPVPGVPIH